MVELILFASERDKGESDPPSKVRNQSPSEKETPRNEGINPHEKNLEGLKCSSLLLVQRVCRNALSLNQSIQMLYVGTAFGLSRLCFTQYQFAVPRSNLSTASGSDWYLGQKSSDSHDFWTKYGGFVLVRADMIAY